MRIKQKLQLKDISKIKDTGYNSKLKEIKQFSELEWYSIIM